MLCAPVDRPVLAQDSGAIAGGSCDRSAPNGPRARSAGAPCSLYSSGLSGLQAHARMNALQVVGNTVRYGAGAAALLWRSDLSLFFAVQAVVAASLTLATRHVLRRMLAEPSATPPVVRLDMARQYWSFSFGMAATAVSAIMLANVDRLALSKMVAAADLGKYAVAPLHRHGVCSSLRSYSAVLSRLFPAVRRSWWLRAIRRGFASSISGAAK